MDHHRPSRQRSPHRHHRRSQDQDDNRRSHERSNRSRSPAHRAPASGRLGDAPTSKHRKHRERTVAAAPVELPCGARPLSKADLRAFEPLLAEYLSLQKQRDVDAMDDRELRGRWKSFVGKWNRGELAEGWYDPETFARIVKDDTRPARMGREEVVKREVEAEEEVVREG
ncbi:hypothetical protein G7046_g9761 [Stylonectria norvegica]|nr:hypothetical protein G7046_g9761 [Stylonectria norvegica]